jgi:uncharacterized protein (TIGR03066 family)
MMVVMSVASAADDKIDAKKLVGKWQPTEKGKMVVMEFTKDGKFQVTTGKKDEDIGGTYAVDGNKVTVTLKFGTMEIKEVLTVSVLSDTELTYTPESKKTAETYTRVKDK